MFDNKQVFITNYLNNSLFREINSINYWYWYWGWKMTITNCNTYYYFVIKSGHKFAPMRNLMSQKVFKLMCIVLEKFDG